MRRFFLFFAVVAAFAGPGFLRAQAGDAVALPPFIVEEATKGPPWRYAEIPGFEILSRCSDRTTRELALVHYRLHRLLELLLPERLQLSFALPRAIIFYDEALQPAASQEVIASMMQRATKESVPLEAPAFEAGRFGSRSTSAPGPARRVSFLPNLRLWDKDAMTVFAIVRDGAVDGDRLALTADYISYLLLNRTPALPWWFVGGLLRLYDRADYEPNALILRPIIWISDDLTAAVKKDPKLAPAPLPLAEFFAGVPPLHPATPEAETRRKVWVAQAALLVRWAIDGRSPEQCAAFWDFVDRAVTGVTPETFQRCFGVDYTTADAQLAAYLPNAVRKSVTLRPPKASKSPPIVLRDASEGEIARIKGDWERLEVGFVRQRTPELASKYLDQARRTLRRAYDHDVRDPRLLAALGLCECDAGEDAAAREFLESAARLGPLRPRAAYELARLRFAEADAKPEGPAGRLSVEQAARVFTPLFAVREQTPPLLQVYELIGKVWARCELSPTRPHLAVLDDGVRLFPRSGGLVYQVATLYADSGFTAEAADFVRLGLVVALDDREHARFITLQDRLATLVPASTAK